MADWTPAVNGEPVFPIDPPRQEDAMLPAVTAVQALPDYRLLLTFENGERKHFDMSPYLHYRVFQRLQKPGFFALARPDYGTVTWPGEIDIAPEIETEVEIEILWKLAKDVQQRRDLIVRTGSWLGPEAAVRRLELMDPAEREQPGPVRRRRRRHESAAAATNFLGCGARRWRVARDAPP
jgi:hypothetical protein